MALKIRIESNTLLPKSSNDANFGHEKGVFMVLKMLAMSLFFTSNVMANTSAVVWTENGSIQRVSQADINLAKKPILGYVYDLRLKENICYEGNDFEVIRILTSGLQRRGTEVCDGNLSIKDSAINLGPCAMPSIHDEEYSLVLPVCK